MNALIKGRIRDRQRQPALPAALGCADPHAEAWLLDDPVAVREALGLPPSVHVPNVRKVDDPKLALGDLHASSPRSGTPATAICAGVAARLDPQRCAHRDTTGLAMFVKDVNAELGPLAAATSQG